MSALKSKLVFVSTAAGGLLALVWLVRRKKGGLQICSDEDSAKLLASLPKNANTAKKHYDVWAGNYDHDLLEWGYTAHLKVAQMWGDYLMTCGTPSGSVEVLDCGCGTGLSGQALAAAGAKIIWGNDISQVSLDLATEKAVYSKLDIRNLDLKSIKYDDNTFSCVVSVGVTSYINHPEGLFREWCRVLVAKGFVIFTVRTDLWDGDVNSIRSAARLLEAEGCWSHMWQSKASAYMPQNPEPSQAALRIYYVLYQITWGG